ncbi:MAG: hypothetical protein VKK80_14265 [Prochlorothrix sp.]|nr:hypothetical protein [Prochlorothrix sp.]
MRSGVFHFGATQPLTWLKRLVVRTLVRPVANVNCTLAIGLISLLLTGLWQRVERGEFLLFLI